MKTYPAMRYHPELELEGRVVHSAEQDAKLGLGWVSEPSKFQKAGETTFEPITTFIESKPKRGRKPKSVSA